VCTAAVRNVVVSNRGVKCTAAQLMVRVVYLMGNGVVGSGGRVVMRHIDSRGRLVMGAY